ncbi:MAG: hypothetical protein ACTSVL_04180 [Promethearchaeota archaeon]
MIRKKGIYLFALLMILGVSTISMIASVSGANYISAGSNQSGDHPFEVELKFINQVYYDDGDSGYTVNLVAISIKVWGWKPHWYSANRMPKKIEYYLEDRVHPSTPTSQWNPWPVSTSSSNAIHLAALDDCQTKLGDSSTAAIRNLKVTAGVSTSTPFSASASCNVGTKKNYIRSDNSATGGAWSSWSGLNMYGSFAYRYATASGMRISYMEVKDVVAIKVKNQDMANTWYTNTFDLGLAFKISWYDNFGATVLGTLNSFVEVGVPNFWDGTLSGYDAEIYKTAVDGTAVVTA